MEVIKMSFLNPLIVFGISIIFFLIMLYRKSGLGISLTVTALLMSFLSVGVSGTATVLIETSIDSVTLTLVLASFFIMVLSILYKETGLVNTLTSSLGGFIKNSKLMVSLLPAVIGLLPVAGGALMSAPMVEAEADKLGLDETKKTYINIWFRHSILPVYPISQFIVLTAALTGTSIDALIARQVIVVIVMIAIGYFIGLRKTRITKIDEPEVKNNPTAKMKWLVYSFLPIIITVILTAAFNLNIAAATLVGVATILVITRTKVTTFSRLLKNRALWEVTLAAFGALLLKNVTLVSGASEILGNTLLNSNLYPIVLLSVVPAVVGFLLGSPSGAIALSVPILAETVTFIPKTASLLYISAYLGYLIAPTHLCLVFTAQYFKSPISKSYKYLLPSTIIAIGAALITYLII
jgi:integral membrane protein (TIGR00529 family)